MRSSVFDYSHSVTKQAIDAILSGLKTPYAEELRGHLQDGRYSSAVGMAMPDPTAYTTAVEFSRDYLAYNLVRKSDFLDLGLDRRQAAIDSFIESERTCGIINAEGKNKEFADISINSRSLEAVIFAARAKIRQLLGVFSWDRANEYFGFSSGASTRLKRATGSPFFKYQGIPEVTPSAAMLAVCDIWTIPLWKEQMLEISQDPTQWVTQVRGSRADTVPKDCKTDRFICIEPDMNMRAQRGIGKLIRIALKRVGVDLDDQSYNQYLALIGSRTGSLATIDLQRASDSIALRLVRDLLPPDWYDAICVTRSEFTNLDGKWIRLEKVSSMGNGYTFELESLIFWALSKSLLEAYEVGDQRLAVYGDDIVIHNSVVEPLIQLLNYVGFSVNKQKSFWSGPFRESCGKHYFYGVDVSPFNIKEVVESEHRSFWLLNSYNAWLERNSLSRGNTWRKLVRLLRKYAPVLRPVPPGSGFESGLEVPVEQAKVVYSLRRQGYLYKVLRPVRRVHKPNGRAALLWWLSQANDFQSDSDLQLMKGEAIYKWFTVCKSRWSS